MYRKGANHERHLMKKLEKMGFFTARSAKSGHESPDIIAGKGGRVFIFECKFTSGDSLYVRKDQLKDESLFSEAFGAEFYIAVKFKRCGWRFFKKEQLKELRKSYRIKKTELKKGKTLKTLENSSLSDF